MLPVRSPAAVRFRAVPADRPAPREVRYPHDVLLGRIWELRRDASAYDAAYLALAEALGAPLPTSDARLGEVPDTRARIEVL